MDDFDMAAMRARDAAQTAGWTVGSNWGRECLAIGLPGGHSLKAEMFDSGHRCEWGSDIEVGEYDEADEFVSPDDGDVRAWVLHFQRGDRYGRDSYAIGEHQHGTVPQAVWDLIDALNRSKT